MNELKIENKEKEEDKRQIDHEQAIKRMKERQKIFSNYLQVCGDPKKAVENYINAKVKSEVIEDEY